MKEDDHRLTKKTKGRIDTIKKEENTRKAKGVWLEAFKKKWTIAGSCLAVGISRQTVYDWLKVDSEFKKKKKEIEEDQIDYTESKLYEAINAGNMTAIIFYLKNMARAKWGAEEKRRFEGEVVARFQLDEKQRNEFRKLIKGGKV